MHNTHTESLAALSRQSVRHWGACALIQPVLANPPGGGLVPHRWGCPMPRVMVSAPEVPPGPQPLADMDKSLKFASTGTQ